MSQRNWSGVNLPPNTPLPENEFFHSDSFAAGYDARDAQEDLPPGSSPSMLDMEVTRDDRLIRAPGVTSSEFLNNRPTQLLLQAGFKFSSELIFVAAPFLGVKTSGTTQWYNVGLRTDRPYGFTNFAGVLLFSNGVLGTYYREPGAKTIAQIPGAPPAFGLTVFAGRVVLGGTLVGNNMDFMGLGWSDSTNDYKGWDYDNGAGYQSMIGSMRQADRFQAFAPIGFDTLAIINRRSIWIGVPTGDPFQPIRFTPRIEDGGCIAPKTVIPTEFGVLFLGDNGVQLFDGNNMLIASEQINADLLPLDETLDYSASFDPTAKRYYLHTPTQTWVLDIIRRRWFRWSGVFSGSIFFPEQPPNGPSWGQLVGTWGQQAGAWWQYLGSELKGKMFFFRDFSLGYEDPSSFSVFGTPLTPEWYDRRIVGDNQDILMTALGSRFTFESTADAGIEIWLPDKPNGNFEQVTSATLKGGTQTRRAWVPYIHTGRGISLGLKITSGSPRIRKASVEFQRTGMPLEPYDIILPPPPPPPLTNYGIIRPRLLYFNGYDMGRHQSQYREVPSSIQNTGSDEDWAYISSGGANGGGHVRSKKRSDNNGQFFILPAFSTANQEISFPNQFVGEPESNIAAMDMIVKFNLFGQTLTQPMNFAAVYSSFIFIRPAQVYLRVMPDLSIQACTLSDVGAPVPIVNPATGLASSIGKVSANGWNTINWQVGLSKFGNDLSGFLVANLHRNEADYVGINLLDLQSVKTRSNSSSDCLNAYGWGTEVIPGAGPGLDNIGFDDVHISGNYGTERRMQGLLSADKLLPIAVGDTIESVITADGTREIPSSPPTTVGIVTVFGVSDRIQNLLGVGLGIDDYVDKARTYNYFLAPNDDFTGLSLPQWYIGWLGPATGVWTTGAWGYQFDVSGTDPGPHEAPTDGSKRRQMLLNGAMDLYRIGQKRPEAIVIAGVQVVSITGIYDVPVNVNNDFIWSLTAPFSPTHDLEAAFHSLLKINGQLITTRTDITDAQGLAWHVNEGYMRNPWSVVIEDAAGRPLTLDDTQIGLKSALEIVQQAIDANPDYGYISRNRVDYAQIALEYSYRGATYSFPAARQSFPIPMLALTIENAPAANRTVIARDTSWTWDGIIVSRVIDWGDGSPTEELEESQRLDPAEVVSWPTKTHVYTSGGSKVITLTATDDRGNARTYQYTNVIPYAAPVAGFAAAGDPGSLSITFTDSSNDLDNDIVTWLWNFGDGTTSTLQNPPAHTYAAPGTYNVQLTVTDAADLSDTSTVAVLVPTSALANCDEFTGTPAAFVQGDDLLGNNPPLPIYGSLDDFNDYYQAIIYRGWYDNAYGDSTRGEYDLEFFTKRFNGGPTLKMLFGREEVSPGNFVTKVGAGWDVSPSDDGTPEVFYTTAPFGPQGLWVRRRYRAEPGVMSDPSKISTSDGSGIVVAGIWGQGHTGALLCNRAGKIYLDIYWRNPASSNQSQTYEVCDESLFDDSILAVDALGELGLLYRGDDVNHRFRVLAYAGPACGMTDAAAMVDTGWKDIISTDNSAVDYNENYNWRFSPQGTYKALWCIPGSNVPYEVDPNPFGYTLPSDIDD